MYRRPADSQHSSVPIPVVTTADRRPSTAVVDRPYRRPEVAGDRPPITTHSTRQFQRGCRLVVAPLVRPRWSPRGRCNHRHPLGCSSATSPRRSTTINPVSSPVTTTIRAARIDDAEKCVTRPVEAAISLTDNHVFDNIRNMICLAPRRQSCDSPRTPPSGYINYRIISVETRCVATSEDSRIYTWNWGVSRRY